MECVNATATISVGKKINLKKIKKSPYCVRATLKCDHKDNLKKFNNVTLKRPGTNQTFLIYRSGKVVIVGSKSESEVQDACHWISDLLHITSIPLPTIHNVVFSGNLFHQINLSTLYDYLRNNSTHQSHTYYEPELSPALIYETSHEEQGQRRKGKILLFRTGRFIITGLTSAIGSKNILHEIKSRIHM
jgi:TATA-box binding protein (TBP) (component of TFIID and TFIIIB)